jgi:hypothetical protein
MSMSMLSSWSSLSMLPSLQSWRVLPTKNGVLLMNHCSNLVWFWIGNIWCNWLGIMGNTMGDGGTHDWTSYGWILSCLLPMLFASNRPDRLAATFVASKRSTTTVIHFASWTSSNGIHEIRCPCGTRGWTSCWWQEDGGGKGVRWGREWLGLEMGLLGITIGLAYLPKEWHRIPNRSRYHQRRN